MSLEERYERAVLTPSDINEHLPVLREYAARCSSVVEIGSWRGLSATALLAGLQDSEEVSRSLELIDKDAGYLCQVLEDLLPLSWSVEFTTQCISSLDVDLEPMDFLFIDSWHVYRQLRAELALHGDKAQRYLGFHDTVSFGDEGEDGSRPGLRTAIREFMATRPHWRVVEDRENNNGLMILERDNG